MRTWSLRVEGLSGLLLPLLLVGCAAGGDLPPEEGSGLPELIPLSWDEFEAQAHRDPQSGVYIFNGDDTAESSDELRERYDGYLAGLEELRAEAEGIGTIEQSLAVYRIGGADQRWSATRARNLTYCVETGGFSASQRQQVIAAIAGAAADWRAATTGVRFVHVSAQDGSCNSDNAQVLFNVRFVSGQPYLASAFFPRYSRENREIRVDAQSFDPDLMGPYTLRGVMRHELGHTLGFVHEHTRPAAGTCYEGNFWRPLTTYDPKSVMHYPQCNGTNTGDLVLTTRDRQGVRALYP